jgi:molecular chaperone IbpA
MTNLSTLRNALQAFDYNHMTPYAVGFDRQFDRLFDYVTHQAESTGGYPPYNIQKTEDYKFEIEMALAGFSKKDIEIEVAEGVLTVKSLKEKDSGSTDDYTLYKGISQRNFTRKFTLADDIVVKGAELKDGMLTISLERIVPEEKKPQLITIK